jgi:DNA-directed RNA polymerase specialized sigma24 family protein
VLCAVVPFLRAVARRRMADPCEAEDAAQDTLLTLQSGASACRSGAST